jgi:hypothetical protein
MRKVLILLTVPALFVALPAVAQQSNQIQYAQNSAAPAEQTGSGSTSGASRAPDPERRICVNTQLSGSHVTRRVCRTAREWQAQGGLDSED